MRRILLIGVCVVLGVMAGTAYGQSRGLQSFLKNVDAAQLELQNGKPEAFKSLWSQADDVTLSGGFGGKIEKGWKAVSARLDWVGTQFSNGTNNIERLVIGEKKDLAYAIQAEHLRFKVPGQSADTARDYRVTMIFRREKGFWRIVHRQADSNNTQQAPH